MKHASRYIGALVLLAALSAGCSQKAPKSDSQKSPGSAASTAKPELSMTDSTSETSPSAGKQKVTPPAASQEVTVVELKAALDNNEDFILLDVRTDREYQEAHLEGTYALIPYEEILGRLDELPADKETYIYCFCRSGRRSSIATNQLSEAGYVHVYNVVGGILAWGGAGYPLQRP